MRPLRTAVAAALLAAIVLTTQAWAAGYAIYEQGAAVLGMAGAGTASVHDASAVFYDPAALTRFEGTMFYVGGSALQPITSFAGTTPYPGYGVTEEMVRQTFYPPTLYLSHRWNERWAAGLGVNSPYGLGVEWKDADTFTGRGLATKVDLSTINGSLCLAYAITPSWSVAAGGDVMFAKVKLRNHTLIPIPGGGGATVDVSANELTAGYAGAPGWNAALHFVPSPQWKLGAFYRSRVVVHLDDGTADFSQILTGNPVLDATVAAELPRSTTASTVLRFPALWSIGAAWLPRPEWTIETDFNLYEWRAFTDLPITFPLAPQLSQDRIEDYSDSWQIRAGMEHRLPAFTYRLGYYFDRYASPVQSVSVLLPDASRHGVTLGLGVPFGADKRWSVDAYELALFLQNRSTDGVNRDRFDGTYKSFVNIAGVGLGFRW